MLMTAYFVFILALAFVDNDTPGAQHYQAMANRAGWVAVAQIPLIVLLAGKVNVIGLLTGVSYERLHVFHRWASRGLLMMASLHFGLASKGWTLYGLMTLEWDTDLCPPTGISAYAFLLCLNLFTLLPLRNWSYGLVFTLHLLSFWGFIVALAYHLWGQNNAVTMHYTMTLLYIACALYLVERLVRLAWYAISNVRPNYATVDALDGGATRLRIPCRQLKRWSVGSHVQLSIPRYCGLLSHPATIVSTPESHDGDMILILRAYAGFTRRVFAAAEKASLAAGLASPSEEEEQQGSSMRQRTHLVLIDGPYGAAPSFTCFDTLFLIAGSSGVTFTTSVLLDLAWKANRGLPLRKVHFIWMIKEQSWLSWVSQELQSATERFMNTTVDLDIQVFVTGDNTAGEKEGRNAAMSRSQDSTSNAITLVSNAEASAKGSGLAVGMADQPWGQLRRGRCSFGPLLREGLDRAEGELAVAACGPLSLTAELRRQVTTINWACERASAKSVYLHIESFHL